MPFHTDRTFRAPEELRTSAFLLRPLRPSNVERDFEAVMESRSFLRTWSQSAWPADDFTLAGNLADLERHEREHLAGDAFTYTVMNLDETVCLGCVYINAPDAPAFVNVQMGAIDGAQWSAYGAAITFWARQSRLADALDEHLLEALNTWFEEDWPLGPHLIVTSESFAQQVATIERVGMQRRFRYNRPTTDDTYLAYAVH